MKLLYFILPNGDILINTGYLLDRLSDAAATIDYYAQEVKNLEDLGMKLDDQD